LDTTATIGIFPRLDDPDVCVAFLLLILVKYLDKTLVFWVIRRFYVERKWNCHFEGILAKTAVVVANVHKKSFLVSQMEIIFELAVYQTRTAFPHSLLQEVCHLNLFPLCPNKVCANRSINGAI
jgi:hypothetical protein